MKNLSKLLPVLMLIAGMNQGRACSIFDAYSVPVGKIVNGTVQDNLSRPLGKIDGNVVEDNYSISVGKVVGESVQYNLSHPLGKIDGNNIEDLNSFLIGKGENCSTIELGAALLLLK